MPAPTRHFEHWPAFLPRSLAVPQTPIAHNLQVSAERYPERTALIHEHRTLSYAALWQTVQALAGWLQKQGLGQGDRVLLAFQNSPEYVIGYYAILRADAVVVPCNPMLLTEELEHLATDSGARIALAAQDLLERFTPLLGRWLDHVVVSAAGVDHPGSTPATPSLADGGPPPQPPVLPAGCTAWDAALLAAHPPSVLRSRPQDLALLPYTSGTTGQPKGCRHTHATMQANIAQYVAWGGYTPNGVFLGTMPFYHVTGMQSMMNAPLAAGATLVLMPRWDREAAARLIARHRVTVWSCITTMMIDFLGQPGLDKHDLSSLLRVGGGGAPMPDAIALRLREMLRLDYIEGYGLTETAAPITYNPQHRPKRQCAGIPLFDVDVRVVDLETGAEVEPGESGEVLVNGPQVFLGYWGQPEADAQAFTALDGKRFFRTGDIGHFDDEGYLFITDRVKRMINAAGFKVWPAEVEALLYHHPGIRECCIVAALDPRRGETVKAYVVARPEAEATLTAEGIEAWARARMAAYKVPRLIEFVPHLPKTASGKILWRVLQDAERNRTGTQA